MINRGTSDRLDDAIDEFEANWSLQSYSKIEKILSHYGLSSDHESIAELIRIDIELRYAQGHPIDLKDYFTRFGGLLESPQYVAGIAYEDFRSRSAMGHSISADRWRGLPGIRHQDWYRRLEMRSFRNANRLTIPQPSTGDAFENALAEEGFIIQQEIGRGAFSRVYLARQADLASRFVVLKVVTEALREPEHMARLQHTNIVPIYSFHKVLSGSVICMPYCGRVTMANILDEKQGESVQSGQSLVSTVLAGVNDTRVAIDKIQQDEPLLESTFLTPAADDRAVLKPLETLQSLPKEKLATWIFARIASALEHSHARGVLHNDLKPSNILIRNDGEPALLDFNLSQSLVNGAAREPGGTLPFMSPETLQSMMGSGVQSDEASDIYSLGTILFKFTTGRLPYPTPASVAEMDLHPAIVARQDQPDWLSTDEVSPGLKSIINRCLQYRARDRYESASQLQQDLQCEHQDLRLRHSVDPIFWRAKKWARRNPRKLTATMVGALLFALIIPLTSFAIKQQAETQQWSSLAQYQAFADESERVLSSLVADPRRREDDGIRKGLEPLEKFHVLEKEGIDHLLSHRDLAEEAQAEETLFRHLGQVAILEAQRLNRLKLQGQLGETDFDRFDQLISALGHVVDLDQSKACQNLIATRAQLADQDQTANDALNRANELSLSNDSESYLEAMRYLANSRFSDASEILIELSDRDNIPSAVKWTAMGRVQYSQKQYANAALSFSHSIERAKTSPALRVLRSRCYAKTNHQLKRIRDLEKAIELDPNFILARNSLGLAYAEVDRLEDAIDTFSETLRLSPDNIFALLKRATIYDRLGNEEQAEKDFALALTSKNFDYSSLLARAIARDIHRDDYEGAVEDVKRAIELKPDRAHPYSELGRFLAAKLNRYEEGIKAYDQALKIAPENEVARIDRAVHLVRVGREEEALQEAQKILSIPPSSRSFYQLACLHALIGTERHLQKSAIYLANAFRKGYEPENLQTDPDLKLLRGRPGYRALVRAFELSKMATLEGATPQDVVDELSF